MATSAATLQPQATHQHAKYDRLIARAKTVPPARTLVVHPCDETSLRGALEPPSSSFMRAAANC
jgi:phosphate acetyltransferase